MKRTYTEEQKAQALAALAANGGNYKATARQIGVPEATLRLWSKPQAQAGTQQSVSPVDNPKLEPAQTPPLLPPPPVSPSLAGGPDPSEQPSGEWSGVFLAALGTGASVVDAARIAGVSAARCYARRVEDGEFAREWALAADIGGREMVREAKRRAFYGTERPVFYLGKVVGYIREYSDTLLMFLIKGRYPEKYRDNHKHEHAGVNGGPIVHVFLPVKGGNQPLAAARAANVLPAK